MSKNLSFRVSNESPQSERRAIAANDRRIHKGVSYSQLAASEADVVSGRYAAAAKTRVIGSGPVEYPALPSSSPWHHDPVPTEEPIGFDVSAAPVVGEPHEVEQSLRERRDGADAPSVPSPGSPSGAAQRIGAELSGQHSVPVARRRRPQQKRRQ